MKEVCRIVFLGDIVLSFGGPFLRVMIQTDCLEAIKTSQVTSFNDSNSTLIRKIHQRLANIGVWDMQPMPRESNNIVDCLVKMAFDTRQNLKVLTITPVVKASNSLVQRNLKLNEELLPSSLQNLLPQDVKKSNEAKEMSGHEFNEERMLIETIDYAETGSNTKHDPLAPPPLI
ncbi:hypothetical protein PVK06_018564 [Gossypium arboreum]|uniref:RNase H type-1 domain-containing protein n=1 Tax=Gossypium arboreum TaxID=29729 RepID=A0ABR0PHC4_GOSAR|nr:hypothetical protein PVK06_018564 [Gossypium arboreum]